MVPPPLLSRVGDAVISELICVLQELDVVGGVIEDGSSIMLMERGWSAQRILFVRRCRGVR